MAKKFATNVLQLTSQTVSGDPNFLYLNSIPIKFNGVTGISVTGSNSLTGLISFTGAGNVSLIQNSNSIIISGASSASSSIVNGVTGSGTATYIPKWVPGGTGLENSSLSETSTLVSTSLRFQPLTRLRSRAIASAISGVTTSITTQNAEQLLIRTSGYNESDLTRVSLQNGVAVGEQKFIYTDSGVFTLLNSGNTLINGNFLISSGSNIKLYWDGTYWKEEYRFPPQTGALTGLLSSASSIVNGVTGSGTVNYIPIWTPGGTGLGNSRFNQFSTFTYHDGTIKSLFYSTPNSTANLTSDGATLGASSTYYLTSDSSTASDRTFHIGNGTVSNQRSLINWASPNSGELLQSDSNLILAADWRPSSGHMLSLMWDDSVSQWREQWRYPNTPNGLAGGTTNYLSKWSSPTTLTSSTIIDDGLTAQVTGDLAVSGRTNLTKYSIYQLNSGYSGATNLTHIFNFNSNSTQLVTLTGVPNGIFTFSGAGMGAGKELKAIITTTGIITGMVYPNTWTWINQKPSGLNAGAKFVITLTCTGSNDDGVVASYGRAVGGGGIGTSVQGNGTNNYLPKWSNSSTLTNSTIIDNGLTLNFVGNYVSGTQPESSTLAIPVSTTVFGSSTGLLGVPKGWIDINISGISAKIPYY